MSYPQVVSATSCGKVGEQEPRIYTVTELTREVKSLLGESFPQLWVEGETSGVRSPQSGHLYLTLKDATAQLPCVMWRADRVRHKFEITDGQQFMCHGYMSVYEPQGRYQFYIDRMEPKGWGALQLAFEQLKERLAREGLFDPSRKRPLPLCPTRIGIVTSPTGAAIRDIVQILRRRFPNLHVLIHPARVQGAGAADDIAEAINAFARLHQQMPIDVLIVGRGGGSLEDLWAFNEEQVARALAASPIPTISAVGHEIDVTIADFVADVRAKTPSEAAELVVATKDELRERVRALHDDLYDALRARLDALRHRLELLTTHHAFRAPHELLADRQQRLDEWHRRAGCALHHQLTVRGHELRGLRGRLHALNPQQRLRQIRERFAHLQRAMDVHMQHALRLLPSRVRQLVGRLDALSPLAILSRGYSLTYIMEGARLFTSVCDVQVGSHIRTQLADGTVVSRVESTHDMKGNHHD